MRSNCSPHFVLGKRPSSRGTGSFGEMTEKICATTNAVFLAEAERYSPKESSKNRCDPQVIYPPPTATNCPPAGGVFIRQVHERVVLLGLAESYTDVVSAMCAGTDRSWATGRQSLRFSGTRRAWYLTGDLASVRGKNMTYVMTKPCPICKRQLTKQGPTDTVHCACGKHVWQG